MAAISPYCSPIRVEFIGGPLVQLLAPLVWTGPYAATIPNAFVCDGGTIPAILWPLVGHPLSASVLPLYLLHDFELGRGVAWGEARRRLQARAKVLPCHPLRAWAIAEGIAIKGAWNRLTRRR
jgi:hypothetical protein